MKKQLFLLVVLLPLLATASVRGDVDGTGGIDGTDINVLINILLGKDNADNYDGRADVNNDTYVDGNDLNVLINLVLGKEVNPPAPGTQTFTVNGVSFTMVTIEGGTFTMGAADDDPDALITERPAHNVTLSGFSIGQTEVTQELWLAVMDSNPSHFSSNNDYADNLQRPVESVDWYKCQKFITKLNQLTGQNFRLPTEAEWEFAARGGNLGHGYKYSGSNNIGDVAWYWGNIPSQTENEPGFGTQSVATKAPNELGLYDMNGNVCEWCNDWYEDYSSDAQTNPTGPDYDPNYYFYRVIRGGCWRAPDWYSRVTSRDSDDYSSISWANGFRLAM